MPGPLDGVRILDLTTVVLGPWAAQILGDMGADIIKIESPDGDPTRSVGQGRSPGMAAVFLNVNRNKRSVALDLKQEGGRAALLRLAAGADVFLHSMRAAAITRLGLDYADMVAVNPDIVYCAAYGYGKGGPSAHRAAYDDLIQGAAGLAALNGHNSGVPAYVPTVIADKTTSMAVVSAIAMALYERERSGKGQEIEVPMFETMVAFTMVEHLFGETFQPPLGGVGYTRTLSPDRKPYRTKDGYIAVLPYSDKQWRSFFAIAGIPEMIEDPRFTTMESRLTNVDAAYIEVERQMATRTTNQWLEALDAESIPASPINAPQDLLGEEHLAAVDFWHDIDHPSEGRLRGIGLFLNFSRTPGAVDGMAPRHGEHTVEVLAECGLGEDEIAALRASGAAVQEGD